MDSESPSHASFPSCSSCSSCCFCFVFCLNLVIVFAFSFSINVEERKIGEHFFYATIEEREKKKKNGTQITTYVRTIIVDRPLRRWVRNPIEYC